MGKLRPYKEGIGKYWIPGDISSLDPSVLSQGVVTILSCVGDVRLDVKEIWISKVKFQQLVINRGKKVINRKENAFSRCKELLYICDVYPSILYGKQSVGQILDWRGSVILLEFQSKERIFYLKVQIYFVKHPSSCYRGNYQARARSARARRACTLRALGLLLADGAPTVGRGKTFWLVNKFFLRKQQ